MNVASTAIQLQPVLLDLVQVAFVIIGAIAVPFANRLFDQVTANTNLKGNATARASIDGVVEDAIAFAKQSANSAVTKVGPIETSNSIVATAGNFILSHAPEELAQLGFTEKHVVDLVRAALHLQSTTEKTT